MKLIIEIDMDNAAFTEIPTEMWRVLYRIGDLIETGHSLGYLPTNTVRDTNGNSVAKIRTEE